jgi:hypothetical protein
MLLCNRRNSILVTREKARNARSRLFEGKILQVNISVERYQRELVYLDSVIERLFVFLSFVCGPGSGLAGVWQLALVSVELFVNGRFGVPGVRVG